MNHLGWYMYIPHLVVSVLCGPFEIYLRSALLIFLSTDLLTFLVFHCYVPPFPFKKKQKQKINNTTADIISAVEFSHDGEHLATGDKGGRVVLFERNQDPQGNDAEYRFFTEFQSHEPEFDYLKSLEIEEKINQIKWLKRRNSSHFLLSVFKA